MFKIVLVNGWRVWPYFFGEMTDRLPNSAEIERLAGINLVMWGYNSDGSRCQTRTDDPKSSAQAAQGQGLETNQGRKSGVIDLGAKGVSLGRSLANVPKTSI